MGDNVERQWLYEKTTVALLFDETPPPLSTTPRA
jgi:hypothetical protein